MVDRLPGQHETGITVKPGGAFRKIITAATCATALSASQILAQNTNESFDSNPVLVIFGSHTYLTNDAYGDATNDFHRKFGENEAVAIKLWMEPMGELAGSRTTMLYTWDDNNSHELSLIEGLGGTVPGTAAITDEILDKNIATLGQLPYYSNSKSIRTSLEAIQHLQEEVGLPNGNWLDLIIVTAGSIRCRDFIRTTSRLPMNSDEDLSKLLILSDTRVPNPRFQLTHSESCGPMGPFDVDIVTTNIPFLIKTSQLRPEHPNYENMRNIVSGHIGAFSDSD